MQEEVIEWVFFQIQSVNLELKTVAYAELL